MPCAWIAVRAEAMPAPSTRTVSSSNGPQRSASSCSEGAATYGTASHGVAASVSAAITGTVNRPLTRNAACTSCAKPCRIRVTAACLACSVLTATRIPSGSWHRWTRPNPPCPTVSSTSYGPKDAGSSAAREGRARFSSNQSPIASAPGRNARRRPDPCPAPARAVPGSSACGSSSTTTDASTSSPPSRTA